MSRLALSIS